MRLRSILGLGAPTPSSSRHHKLVDAIRARIGVRPPARIELIAAFAGLLVRVAHTDLEISTEERAMLRRLIQEHVGLSPDEAAAVATVTTEYATGLAGIDYAALTRAFNEQATPADKQHLVECLYAIAAAGDSISVGEDEEIRAVARALLLSHAQVIAIRRRHADSLEVLQAVRQRR
jgi:uncharacterized tellurite resistance protein B-like protein